MFQYPYMQPLADGQVKEFRAYVARLIDPAGRGSITATVNLVNVLDIHTNHPKMEDAVAELVRDFGVPTYDDLIAPAKTHITRLVDQAKAGRPESLIDLIEALNGAYGAGVDELPRIFGLEPLPYGEIESLSNISLLELMMAYPWAFPAVGYSLTQGIKDLELDPEDEQVIKTIYEANLRLRLYGLGHLDPLRRREINRLGTDGLEIKLFAKVAKKKLGLNKRFFRILAGSMELQCHLPFPTHI